MYIQYQNSAESVDLVHLDHYSRNAVYELEETNHQNINGHLSENETDWVHEFWGTDWYVIHNIKIFWL